MDRVVEENVLSLKSPVSNVSGMVFTGSDVCVLGTMEGSISSFECHYHLVDNSRTFRLGELRQELKVIDTLPIDCLVAAERSMLIAALHSTNKVVLVHVTSSGELEIVWSCELPEGEIYTNRNSAHCWETPDSLLVGCFSGAIVRVIRDKVSVVARDSSAITQLTVDSTNGMLVSSSVNRNCISNLEAGTYTELKQVGQKPRDQGYYGACSFAGKRIFAARHNNRVFEADETTVVLRTYKMPEGTPLGLLYRLQGTEEEQAVVWSESPQFAAAIVFSPSRSEVLWCKVPPEGVVVVCSAMYRDCMVVLFSDDTIDVCPFREGAPPLPPPELTVVPPQDEPILKPKTVRKVSLIKVVKRRIVKTTKNDEESSLQMSTNSFDIDATSEPSPTAAPEAPTAADDPPPPPPPPPPVSEPSEPPTAQPTPPVTESAVEVPIIEPEEPIDNLPDLSDFIDRVHKLYRTFGARQLDKKAQPQILNEVLALLPEIKQRLDRKRPVELARESNAYFLSDEASELHVLLKASFEWVLRLPLFDDSERVDKAVHLWGLLIDVGAISRFDESDVVGLYEDTARRLGPNVHSHDFVRAATHGAIDILFPRRNLPLLPVTSTTVPSGCPQYTPIENHLINQSLGILEELQLGDAPSCATRYYFPYLFAVFPSKAMNTAISSYPALSIRFLEEAVSGHVYNEALSILRRHGCTVDALNADDVLDYFCDMLLLVAQEHKDKLQVSTDCLPRLISQLLARRANMTDDIRGSQHPGMLRRKKRVEDTVLDLIKTCPLNITIAHPSLRDICDRFEFAEGIVALRAIPESINAHVASDRIDKLMPLYSLPEANTEGNWVTLFLSSHNMNRLDAAVMLCVALHVQQPKRVRSYLRKSFPFLDSPDLTDEQLRLANRKLAVIIGG